MANDTTNIQDEITFKLRARIVKLKTYIKDNTFLLSVIYDEILFLENIIKHINKFNN